jgi:hypothetical protein
MDASLEQLLHISLLIIFCLRKNNGRRQFVGGRGSPKADFDGNSTLASLKAVLL